jgi:hypothetical protein
MYTAHLLQMISMDSLPHHWPPPDDLERASMWPGDQKPLVQYVQADEYRRMPEKTRKKQLRRRLRVRFFIFKFILE